ncbi:MAG TPA: T9SS type A sorting domain-containing protein [Chitinophagaceae bacterium]|nr:T9SS type A sorting domain-containing protein [Chitinophagaceae bacterium]
MRKSLRYCALATGSILLLTTLAKSQSNHVIYAVTDIQKQGSNWSYLRKLNLQTKSYSDVLLNGTNPNQTAYDALTKQQIENFNTAAKYNYPLQPAFSSGVAALAYDKKSNHLYYTPMFIDQLRYIDLKTMKVYYVTDQELTGIAVKSSDQGNVVTRMTIANDGAVYAMTNDATHLIRINTGKDLIIEDLGTIVDDQSNKGISIHNSCSSYGGDMIADNEGNLYIITARNNVFKLNVDTKIATHIAIISGLPPTFSTNGAAVDDNNKIIVSSAADSSASYFIVDPQAWSATAYKISGDVWRSSDLASNYVLNAKKSSVNTLDAVERPADLSSNKIQVYPNPVTENQFTLQFSQLAAGSYSIQITDVMGRQVIQRFVNINADEQTENIKLQPNTAKGIYLIKVTDQGNRSVFSKKLVVQ